MPFPEKKKHRPFSFRDILQLFFQMRLLLPQQIHALSEAVPFLADGNPLERMDVGDLEVTDVNGCQWMLMWMLMDVDEC